MQITLIIQPSKSELGFSHSVSSEVFNQSVKDFRVGFQAFLLGKSVTSGRGIFDRDAFSRGWLLAEKISRLHASLFI